MDQTSTAQDEIKRVKDRIGPKIVTYMERVRELLIQRKHVVSTIDEMSMDNYQWSVIAYYHGHGPDDKKEDGLDFTVQIAESAEYDGEMENGINFMSSIVAFSGQIFGSISPFNYTSEVWVPASDDNAVDKRFDFFMKWRPSCVVREIHQVLAKGP